MTYDDVLAYNRRWAAEKAKDPSYFPGLTADHSPDYLYIGCSDSRVPADEILGVPPGEVFVHRNVANVVANTDLNVAAVIEYAVTHLQVKHILVCGHTHCGGVKAAMEAKDLGLLNPWLRNIRDVYRMHKNELNAIEDGWGRYDRLVELSVIEQCINVIKTAAVQQSYAKHRIPTVHGWVFDLETGLIKDLDIDFEERLHELDEIYNLTDRPWF